MTITKVPLQSSPTTTFKAANVTKDSKLSLSLSNHFNSLLTATAPPAFAATVQTVPVVENYQTVVEECKARVAAIAAACRKQNIRFRDRFFDLKFDEYDCLNSLSKPDESLWDLFDSMPRNASGSCERIPKLFDKPTFFKDGGMLPGDIEQGYEGDCWFLAALSILASDPELLLRIMVARDEQVGVYGFVFNRDGQWITSIVDDQLSVLRAVEAKGRRFLLIRNPWGNSEWTGPWSDGSSEWTGEWMTLLSHRFGNDGQFWMEYCDVLNLWDRVKRAQIFDNNWFLSKSNVELQASFPATYSKTVFDLTITSPGPVTIALSQIDTRYFNRLEGEYEYALTFQVTQLAEDGTETPYTVSSTAETLTRTRFIEIPHLEPGLYRVYPRVTTTPSQKTSSVDEIIKFNGTLGRQPKIERQLRSLTMAKQVSLLRTQKLRADIIAEKKKVEEAEKKKKKEEKEKKKKDEEEKKKKEEEAAKKKESGDVETKKETEVAVVVEEVVVTSDATTETTDVKIVTIVEESVEGETKEAVASEAVATEPKAEESPVPEESVVDTATATETENAETPAEEAKKADPEVVEEPVQAEAPACEEVAVEAKPEAESKPAEESAEKSEDVVVVTESTETIEETKTTEIVTEETVAASDEKNVEEVEEGEDEEKDGDDDKADSTDKKEESTETESKDDEKDDEKDEKDEKDDDEKDSEKKSESTETEEEKPLDFDLSVSVFLRVYSKDSAMTVKTRFLDLEIKDYKLPECLNKPESTDPTADLYLSIDFLNDLHLDGMKTHDYMLQKTKMAEISGTSTSMKEAVALQKQNEFDFSPAVEQAAPAGATSIKSAATKAFDYLKKRVSFNAKDK
ncbi:hypothetical protein HDU79_007449 [Rhizoclosmatium sp. JEL0117]|nr:hypothetical protein HDU79_007449 [Rhizoclosmatium sp. JEL0117]